MTCILEGTHPLERDGATDVDVGRGDVDAELDPEWTAELQLLVQPLLGKEMHGVASQDGDGSIGAHGEPIVPTPG